MIERICVIRTEQTNPYHNLALEEILLHDVPEGEVILYLWQNARTVVIGRNQSAERECNIEELTKDGGHLARRLSGGGAVYHDLGNLNFTFLAREDAYDVNRQTQVILQAVRRVGIDAEKNGRNDLTVNGRKFSGHAYYHTGDRMMHHGTLMVNVEQEPLSRYLQVSSLKLAARGVSSVHARVLNLCDENPDLMIADLAEALILSFEEEYGLFAVRMQESGIEKGRIQSGEERFSSPLWLYGKKKSLKKSVEGKFSWGLLRIDFTDTGGVIEDMNLASDGLDADYLASVPDLLKGCPLEEKALAYRLGNRQEGKDIADLLIREGAD